MVFTLFGITIEVKLIQSLNADLPIVSNCSGKSTFFNASQPVKAYSPIDVISL